MIKQAKRDTIDIDDFAYLWRIRDARWDTLSDDLIRQILPLAPQRSQEVKEMSLEVCHQGPYSLRTENYCLKLSSSLTVNNAEDEKRIGRWLSSIPILSEEKIYVCWVNADPSTAIITSWETFKRVWDSLWYPFDAMSIFDETLKWAILLGPEENAVYVERV